MPRFFARIGLLLGCTLALASIASAATLCVNPSGSHGCYSKIQSAVNAATPASLILAAAGTYKEKLAIGKRLQVSGAGPGHSIIDAPGLGNGVLVDGYLH